MRTFIYILLFTLASLQVKAQSRSELFLEIQERGNYTVYADDQFAGSSTGKFRFYELKAGKNLLTIQFNGKQIFKDYIILNPDSRTLLSFSRGKIRTMAVKPIYRDNQYSLDNWDGEMRQGGGRPGRVYQQEMAPARFASLLAAVKKESFDADKQNVIKVALRDNFLTVGQLSDLLKQLSFEDKKLEMAIYAYPNTVDPGNYYQIRGLFTFSSNKEKLDSFLLVR